MGGLHTRFTRLLNLLVFMLMCAGCAHYQIRIIVQDSDDKPIPGAIVYFESYDQHGAKDFTWVYAGDEIKVPPLGKPPISLKGSNETDVAIAIFAEGKKPVVVYDPKGVLNPELWEYMMERDDGVNPAWNPELTKLQFPFLHQYDLHNRLKLKQNEPLVRAFMRAYSPLQKQMETSQARSSEIEKYEFVRDKLMPVFQPLSKE